jgi:hypothetical protein
MKHPRHWKPLQRATGGDHKPEAIQATMDHYKCDREKALEILDKGEANAEYWINDLYQVRLEHYENGMVHLNIRRKDGSAHRDWRHFQEIKNQLLGPECEAIELYPAESRKVDAANKFHLWGVQDPTFRFPVGFEKRDVNYNTEYNHIPGMKQRPL